MSLTRILKETPQISLKGKIAYADKHKLKDLETEKVSKNIVILRQPEDSFMLPKGFTLVYFMDTEENARKMGNGEFPYIIIPQGSSMFGRETPFQKAFKQNKDGIEHILGFIQGYTDEDTIFVDFMRVRHKYKRNSINTKMIKALEHDFPNAKVTFSKPTDQGKEFIKSKYPNALEDES